LDEPRESLLINLDVGEKVSIDSGRVIVTVNHKSGRRASLHFSSEKGVAIEPLRVLEVKQA
jgi:hypothetical protein